MDEETDITMTPEYEFTFDNHEDRLSSEIEAAAEHPEAIEMLAELGRQDDAASVKMIGMTN